MTDLAATEPLPQKKRDFIPLLLPVVLALAMIPLIGSPSTWVTLTVASLAMGMMIFIMASGLTLVFGLMDVLNFGHGAFIAVGAYVATLVLAPLAPYVQAEFAVAQSHRPCARSTAVDGGIRCTRPRVRARADPSCVRQSPQADPHHHGRIDRHRADALRAVGAGTHTAAPAVLAARLFHPRRYRDHENTAYLR